MTSEASDLQAIMQKVRRSNTSKTDRVRTQHGVQRKSAGTVRGIGKDRSPLRSQPLHPLSLFGLVYTSVLYNSTLTSAARSETV